MNYFYEFINFSGRIYLFGYISILLFEKINLIELILLVCDCVLGTLDIEVKHLNLQSKRMFFFCRYLTVILEINGHI